MSFFQDAQNTIEGIWDENGNKIMTVAAIIGFGASLYFTAKGSVKANEKVKELQKQKEEDLEDLTTMDIVKEVAPEVLPSIAAAAFTIACIISNYKFNEEQKIALCGAYAMLGKSYEKYRKTVKEVAGEETAKKVDVAMAEDVYIRQQGGKFCCNDDLKEVEHYKEDECTFFDPLSEVFFRTTPAQVRNAIYHLNRKLQLRGDVSLWEFYQFLGIDEHIGSVTVAGPNDRKPKTHINRKKLQKLGWDCDFLLNEYESTWLDFDIEKIELTEDRDEPSGYFVVQPVIQPRILEYPYTYC